jgi:hypothetical protein
MMSREITCGAEGGFSSLSPYEGKPVLGVSFVADLDALREEVIRIVNAAPMGCGHAYLPLGHHALVIVHDAKLTDFTDPFAAGGHAVHVGSLEVMSELCLFVIVKGDERRVLLEEAGMLFEPGAPRRCQLCSKPLSRRDPFYSLTDEYGEACYCMPCRDRMVALASTTADRLWALHRFGE